MLFMIALAAVCLGVLLLAVGLISAMGIMTAAQSFGAGRSDAVRKQTDTTERKVLRGTSRVLLIGLGLVAVGFLLMLLAGA